LSTEVSVVVRAAPEDDIRDARHERLVRVIVADLKAQTDVQAMVTFIEDVDEWRAAARIAGRRLGLRVRTEVRCGAVYLRVIDLATPEWVCLRDLSRRLSSDRQANASRFPV
jgi:hypothetical protein